MKLILIDRSIGNGQRVEATFGLYTETYTFRLIQAVSQSLRRYLLSGNKRAKTNAVTIGGTDVEIDALDMDAQKGDDRCKYKFQ